MLCQLGQLVNVILNRLLKRIRCKCLRKGVHKKKTKERQGLQSLLCLWKGIYSTTLVAVASNMSISEPSALFSSVFSRNK